MGETETRTGLPPFLATLALGLLYGAAVWAFYYFGVTINSEFTSDSLALSVGTMAAGAFQAGRASKG